MWTPVGHYLRISMRMVFWSRVPIKIVHTIDIKMSYEFYEDHFILFLNYIMGFICYQSTIQLPTNQLWAMTYDFWSLILSNCTHTAYSDVWGGGQTEATANNKMIGWPGLAIGGIENRTIFRRDWYLLSFYVCIRTFMSHTNALNTPIDQRVGRKTRFTTLSVRYRSPEWHAICIFYHALFCR